MNPCQVHCLVPPNHEGGLLFQPDFNYRRFATCQTLRPLIYISKFSSECTLDQSKSETSNVANRLENIRFVSRSCFRKSLIVPHWGMCYSRTPHNAYPSVDGQNGIRYEGLCIWRGMPKIKMVERNQKKIRKNHNCHIMVQGQM
jgi:hypothetical protein